MLVVKICGEFWSFSRDPHSNEWKVERRSSPSCGIYSGTVDVRCVWHGGLLAGQDQMLPVRCAQMWSTSQSGSPDWSTEGTRLSWQTHCSSVCPGESGWGCPGPRCGLLGDSLLVGGATWASSNCTAISGLGAGMWYWEVGSLGAKG